MAIIVESGSGATLTANSYVTLASCAEYLNSKGLTTWASATTTAREVSLINAQLWMELLPWRGQKSLSTDPLVWPRRSVFDRDGYPVYSDTIPIQIKRAQCELAYRSYLNKSPFIDIATGDGYVIREAVGPIEISYAQGYSTSYKFPEIDALLLPFLDNSLSVIIERA
jgi:hypothetical protein